MVTEVYILELVEPGRYVAPADRFIKAYADLDRALDKRRTKLANNVDWRPGDGDTWTTRSMDYTFSRYPYYVVTRVPLA